MASVKHQRGTFGAGIFSSLSACEGKIRVLGLGFFVRSWARELAGSSGCACMVFLGLRGTGFVGVMVRRRARFFMPLSCGPCIGSYHALCELFS
jgi:hypothetical protein